jgi:hypothetical protein
MVTLNRYRDLGGKRRRDASVEDPNVSVLASNVPLDALRLLVAGYVEDQLANAVLKFTSTHEVAASNLSGEPWPHGHVLDPVIYLDSMDRRLGLGSLGAANAERYQQGSIEAIRLAIDRL